MAARTIPRSLSRTTVIAVLIATIAALVARSWLQLRLLAGDMAPQLAADLSYLAVPPTMAILLFPLWRSERSYLRAQFRMIDLDLRLVLSAILVGVLLRLMWWGQLVFGISFGFYTSPDPDAVVGPVFSFQCPNPELIALSFLVMSMLTPVVEEVVHRAYLLGALRKRGMLQAVAVSALVFAILHNLTSMPFAFLAGLIFGVQYWNLKSLWPSLISHGTWNTLILLDWRCLSGNWNPASKDLPLWLPGIASSLIILICGAMLYGLLRGKATEA